MKSNTTTLEVFVALLSHFANGITKQINQPNLDRQNTIVLEIGNATLAKISLIFTFLLLFLSLYMWYIHSNITVSYI